jgi:hypothetical protein
MLIPMLHCIGQVKVCDIPKYKNGELSVWYQWTQNDTKRAGLPDLTQSSDSLHFRFLTETQSVDIWTNDYKTFSGTFANFTTSKPCTNCLIKDESKFYSRKYPLDTATSRQIYDYFGNLNIFKIPAQDSIEGWSSGCDGEVFSIEYSSPTHYSFKNYWTPSAFTDKIKYAADIDSLVHLLEEKLQMPISFAAFIDVLPLGCYSAGGYMITFRTFKKPFIVEHYDF